MKKIKLTQGKYAVVDNKDFKFLNQWKWYCAFSKNKNTCYPAKANGNGGSIKMYKFLIETPNGMVVDHKNRNGLDNRRSNLRVCLKGENKMNQKIYRNNSSGFKGVHLKTNPRFKIKKWQARISLDYKRISIGYFRTAREAALAYNKMAKILHGEYARLNTL